MPVSATTLRLMMDAGLAGEQLLAVVESVDADMETARPVIDVAAERRRAKDRERKRDERAASAEMSADKSADAPPLSDKENGTKEINSSPPSLRSDVFVAREPASVAPEPMCRIEFDMEFWPAVMNRVSRPTALAAFIRARQRASLTEILDGLRRYQENRPRDQKWMNPAKFLDEDRFNDEPAPAPQGQSGSASSRQRSILDGVAQAVERRSRLGGWEAEAHARRGGDGGTGPPDRGGDFEDRGELARGTG